MPILVQVAMALERQPARAMSTATSKPANILVRRHGEADGLRHRGRRVRSPWRRPGWWARPGTCSRAGDGRDLTPIGDLYALGTSSLTGRPPVGGHSRETGGHRFLASMTRCRLPDFVPEPLADVILPARTRESARESGSAAVREIASAAKAMGVSVLSAPASLPKAAQHITTRKSARDAVDRRPVRLTRRTLPTRCWRRRRA